MGKKHSLSRDSARSTSFPAVDHYERLIRGEMSLAEYGALGPDELDPKTTCLEDEDETADGDEEPVKT